MLERIVVIGAVALAVGCSTPAEKPPMPDGRIEASAETKAALGVTSWTVQDGARLEGVDESGRITVRFEAQSGTIAGEVAGYIGWLDYTANDDGSVTIETNDFADFPEAVEAARLAARDLQGKTVPGARPQGLHINAPICLVYPTSDATGVDPVANCGESGAPCAESVARSNLCAAAKPFGNTAAPSCITYTTEEYSEHFAIGKAHISNGCDKPYKVRLDVSFDTDTACVNLAPGQTETVAYNRDRRPGSKVHGAVLC